MPLGEYLCLQFFEIEQEGEEDVDFDWVLTKNDLLELVEGEFVHAEADEVGEDCEESGIVFAVCRGGKLRKDGIVGGLQECPVALAAIEYLLHEYAFSVLAFYA